MPRRRARRNSFGTIIATGSKSHPAFSIRWWEGSQRRKTSGFKTRTEAAEALARVRAGLSDGTMIVKRGASIGFDKVAESWLDLHSKPSLRSHPLNQLNYDAHVEPYFKDTPLAAVTAERVLQFRAHLQRKTRAAGKDDKGESKRVPISPGTVNVVLRLLRSILKFAAATGYIPASPTDRIARGKLMLPVEEPKLAPPIATPEDVGRLLAELLKIAADTRRPSLFALFAFLLYTGARKGEAIGLRLSDIDLKGRMVTIRHSYQGTTKNAKHRPVPIPPDLLPILRRQRLADPWKGGPDHLAFPNEAGEMWSKNARIREVLHLACDRCGIPRIKVHDLRHTYAAFYLMAGGNLYDLQKNLGHHSVAFTAKIYGHLSADHRIREAGRVSYPAPAKSRRAGHFG